MIVVDTNVIAGLFLHGPTAADVERLYRRDTDWISSPLWYHEFLNVLCTKMRVEQLPFSTAAMILSTAEQFMHGRALQPPARDSLEISQERGCSGYDAQFIALALHQGVPLYTYDKRILKACPDIARQPEPAA